MELNLLKETPFDPNPAYYYSNYLPLGEYIYGVRYGSSVNTYSLDKLDFGGNFENLSFDRGLVLSADGAGNAYLLANGQVRQLKR